MRGLIASTVFVCAMLLSGYSSVQAADFKATSGAEEEASTEVKAHLPAGDVAGSSVNSLAIAYGRSRIFTSGGFVYGEAITRTRKRVSLIQARNYTCEDGSCSTWISITRRRFRGKVWANHYVPEDIYFYHNYFSKGKHRVVFNGVTYRKTTTARAYL